MFTVNGIPAHPLVIQAVVVLRPLITLGAVLIAIRPRWRSTYGIPVLFIVLVGVAAVPIATNTGEQLQRALLGPDPPIELHGYRADMLPPWAVAFLAVTAITRFRGRQPDTSGSAVATSTRLTTVLAALLAPGVTGLVVWTGDAGATAVRQGVGSWTTSSATRDTRSRGPPAPPARRTPPWPRPAAAGRRTRRAHA